MKATATFLPDPKYSEISLDDINVRREHRDAGPGWIEEFLVFDYAVDFVAELAGGAKSVDDFLDFGSDLATCLEKGTA